VPVGAHLRYLVEICCPSPQVVGCLQLSSPAWKMKARDKFIGWSAEGHRSNLQKVVNNSRFLIGPWVHVEHLASRVLGQMARQFPKDWERAYGIRPLLLEHDFGQRDAEGRVIHGIPYGVYEQERNVGWVSVGVDHDTAQFAVATIEQWWEKMGRPAYPNSGRVMITADSGGRNGRRVRAWKTELQRLSDVTGLEFHVSHYPPGTSKWNKIEHRMFSQITLNWRGRPLTSHETIVNLIANTKTKTVLHIEAALDTSSYPTGIKISDKQLAAVNIERDEFHPEWNYAILPSSPTK
jgi:hypothetical protein